MVGSSGMTFDERLEPSWRSKPKGVDALVVVTSNKHRNPSGGEVLYELLVRRIEVLELIHDNVGRIELCHRVNDSRRCRINGTPDYLTW
jgi:hypothetical protein